MTTLTGTLTNPSSWGSMRHSIFAAAAMTRHKHTVAEVTPGGVAFSWPDGSLFLPASDIRKIDAADGGRWIPGKFHIEMSDGKTYHLDDIEPPSGPYSFAHQPKTYEQPAVTEALHALRHPKEER